MNFFIINVLFALFLLSKMPARVDTIETGYQCCGLNTIEGHSTVFVETNRPLAIGTYQAVRLRACNSYSFSIQLWTCLPSLTTCGFVWQNIINPSPNNSLVINLDQPVSISSSYRFGIYSAYNSTIAVPFGVESNLAFLSESINNFNNVLQFQSGVSINLDPTLVWSRTFASSIIFCKLLDCLDVPPSRIAPLVPITDNPAQPPTGQCCQQTISCDPTKTVGGIDTNSVLIQQLQNQISKLQTTINNINGNSNQITGYCPANFITGDYGLGSCYLPVKQNLSFAEAAMFCKDQYSSNLVQINSYQEDLFLRNYLLGLGSTQALESYWTAAMYQYNKNDWYWYDNTLDAVYPIYYSNWQNGIKPVATSVLDICSTMVIDYTAKADYWNKAICNQANYVICKLPKTCY